MSFDDFLFYLPGYASIPLLAAGALAAWLAWRLLAKRKTVSKKNEPVEKSQKM